LSDNIKCPECWTNLGRKVACPSCGMVAELQILDERSCDNCRHKHLLGLTLEEELRLIGAGRKPPCQCCMRNQPYDDNWEPESPSPNASLERQEARQ
jgi:hypothetical protein